ncbi:helix-turn-helix domain-containing protein [Ottowia thiooxydans]|uniref:Transcriptional regulator with XRE-family HTH domain n=1 Tax=Ottowia thiooxydans TaxID=219182 RepID=A0ABV2QC03_9BURK
MSEILPLRKNALGDFLRARRAEVRPTEVGLPLGVNARRVPGLRREEVAQLAGISSDYYNRLEQGRLMPSAPVLAAIGRGLKLDTDQTAYLRRLVQGAPHGSVSRPLQTVGPQTARLIALLGPVSVVVFGRCLDVLGWNAVAAELLGDFSACPANERNFIRMAFLDPGVRARYVDWETSGRQCVAYLRMDMARYPDDARLNALVSELSEKDADFRTWWTSHQVAIPSCGQKSVMHPVVGQLTLDWQMLGCAEDPDQMIYIMSAPSGQPAANVLAGWQNR